MFKLEKKSESIVSDWHSRFLKIFPIISAESQPDAKMNYPIHYYVKKTCANFWPKITPHTSKIYSYTAHARFMILT